MISIVVVVWLLLAGAYGLFLSFPVFFVPLLEEFQWSRALTAGAVSVSTIVQAALSPVAGILVDRIGTRPVILAGVVMLSAASILMGFVTDWKSANCISTTGLWKGCSIESFRC